MKAKAAPAELTALTDAPAASKARWMTNLESSSSSTTSSSSPANSLGGGGTDCLCSTLGSGGNGACASGRQGRARAALSSSPDAVTRPVGAAVRRQLDRPPILRQRAAHKRTK